MKKSLFVFSPDGSGELSYGCAQRAHCTTNWFGSSQWQSMPLWDTQHEPLIVDVVVVVVAVAVADLFLCLLFSF